MMAADPLQLAQSLIAQGQFAQAEAALRRAVQRLPKDALAHVLLARVLITLRKPDQAEYFASRAAALASDDPLPHATLADALAARGSFDAAIAAFHSAIARPAGSPPPHALYTNLAALLIDLGRIGEAHEAFHAAFTLAPDAPLSSMNLAQTHLARGQADEALRLLTAGMLKHPTLARQQAVLLSTLNYHASTSRSDIRSHADRMRHILSADLPPPAPFALDRSPDRRLRLGFLSPDLRRHSVTQFLLPVLRALDRTQFDLCFYSSTDRSDAVTAELRALATLFRDVRGISDPDLAAGLRADKIDIAIDLAGHTQGSRVQALRFRAAPVQLSYLGYPAITGVPNIDYRLVDTRTDPPQDPGAEPEGSERLVRFAPCFLAYTPPADTPPPILSPPAQPAFVSFNTVRKLSPRCAALWARILHAAPESRLILKSDGLQDAWVRDHILALFTAHDIAINRIELLPTTASHADHLALYARASVALDPTPYAGTTTTCEALSMGVPVVTLDPGPAAPHASRVGVSLLAAADLPELIAPDDDAYIALALALVRQTDQLAAYRSTLRDRLAASTLGDVPALAQHLSAALRTLWRTALTAQ